MGEWKSIVKRSAEIDAPHNVFDVCLLQHHLQVRCLRDSWNEQSISNQLECANHTDYTAVEWSKMQERTSSVMDSRMSGTHSEVGALLTGLGASLTLPLERVRTIGLVAAKAAIIGPAGIGLPARDK